MNILIAPKIMIAIFKLISMNLASLIKTPPPLVETENKFK